MSAADDAARAFGEQFDDTFPVGPHPGNRAFFGRDVLRGLTQGIEEFVQPAQPRWRQHRSCGPVLLGSAMWINDPELVAQLTTLTGACVVVTKQGRHRHDREKLQRLEAVNARTPGLPVRAFSALTDLAPRVDGKPAVVGPYSREYEGAVPTVRTLGFRKRDRRQVPLLHAKLALLGHLWWHDEDESGAVADVFGFTGKRLWVSSANFTSASRDSLEFGYWTEDPDLLRGAQRFLLTLIGSSERLDPASDLFEPDLMPVDYDDAAFAQAFADSVAAVDEEEDLDED